MGFTVFVSDELVHIESLKAENVLSASLFNST